MAVKGAVLGDILGSQYEFNKPENLDWENVPLDSGENTKFTDDTVLTLAIKKAYMENLDLVNTVIRIGRAYPYCGYGFRFALWMNSEKHEAYNSWGNGSAMRVSYIGESIEDFEKMQEEAKRTAEFSHNHPEGIKGAVVTASCIWMAKHGASKEKIYDYVLKEYPGSEYLFSIDHSIEELREKYTWSEKCCDTVPVAVRCFYESKDYESFMRNIYSLDCDSDTFGAVAGGIAEEYYRGFGNIDADEIFNKYLDEELLEILMK